MQIDKEFPSTWPFGTLKTIHWLAPLFTIITLYIGLERAYDSVDFVIFTALNIFLYSLITWICYLMGLQRTNIQIGSSFVFIPFLLLDFIVAGIGTIVFGLNSLLCLIAMFHALNYKITNVLTYLFATILCLISAAAYGYFTILIYRKCPNGNLKNLMTMYLEGNDVSFIGNTPGAGSSDGNRPQI